VVRYESEGSTYDMNAAIKHPGAVGINRILQDACRLFGKIHSSDLSLIRDSLTTPSEPVYTTMQRRSSPPAAAAATKAPRVEIQGTSPDEGPFVFI
jgi:hypothetical protein